MHTVNTRFQYRWLIFSRKFVLLDYWLYWWCCFAKKAGGNPSFWKIPIPFNTKIEYNTCLQVTGQFWRLGLTTNLSLSSGCELWLSQHLHLAGPSLLAHHHVLQTHCASEEKSHGNDTRTVPRAGLNCHGEHVRTYEVVTSSAGGKCDTSIYVWKTRKDNHVLCNVALQSWIRTSACMPDTVCTRRGENSQGSHSPYDKLDI